jgi:hypothetical protein
MSYLRYDFYSKVAHEKASKLSQGNNIFISFSNKDVQIGEIGNHQSQSELEGTKMSWLTF